MRDYVKNPIGNPPSYRESFDNMIDCMGRLTPKGMWPIIRKWFGDGTPVNETLRQMKKEGRYRGPIEDEK